MISWRAFTGDPAGSATLSRVGPITAGQALPLALTAAFDPHARWQVIVTDADGYAIAVETVRRRPRRARWHAGVTGQVSVTIPATTLDDSSSIITTGRGIQAAVLRAARRAWPAPAARPPLMPPRPADALTPPPRPATGQPARSVTTSPPGTGPAVIRAAASPPVTRTLTTPPPGTKAARPAHATWARDCRTHHKIKQLPGWTLTQTKPGYFQLTTLAGRIYTTRS